MLGRGEARRDSPTLSPGGRQSRVNEAVRPAREAVLKHFGITVVDMTRGDFDMIFLKITGLCVLVAGALVALLTTQLGPDLALVVLAGL